jgi:peptidoglycan/LPS O-acetylase OafA/YrhL
MNPVQELPGMAPLSVPQQVSQRVRTLADGLESRRDNFLLLRFIAASMVIYGHGKALTGGKGWPDLFVWLGWGTYSGTLAVYIFFVVSGFMIAGSYLRRQHLADFLWARVLRIFPAYLFCLALSAFVLGAIYTSLPASNYYRDPSVLHYVTHNMKLRTNLIMNLPGVFTDNPAGTTVNGAIWTLPAEFRMYMWVALVGLLGVLSRRWLCNLIIVTMFGLGIVHPDRDILMIPGIFLHLAAMFGFGAFCYINRRYIPVGWPYVAVTALMSYLLRDTMIYPFVFGLAITQFSFTFAYCIPWHGFNRFGDYSYGIYLWGFPMQQVIAHHFPTLSPIGNTVAAFFPALALAVLSWNVIEKPALKLKNVPSRLLDKFREHHRRFGVRRDSST